MAPATVDEYFAQATPEARERLGKLRTAIRSVVPDATETISYQMPAFRAEGRMLVWYAAFRGHSSLFPANARVVEALGDELKPYLSGRGTIRFPLDEPIPEALVRRVVEVRLEENRAEAGQRESAKRSRGER
jgi:uncharacterized protein YdhG (YjbR/CyaY superfamily)